MAAARPSLLALVLVLSAGAARANSAGITLASGRPGTDRCSACHVHSGVEPAVTVIGPPTLALGATGDYVLTVTGGPGAATSTGKAGMNVALDDGSPATLLGGVDTVRNPDTNEVSHAAGARRFEGASSLTFHFSVQAPQSAGALTLYAATNSVNGDTQNTGDHDAVTTFRIDVVQPSPPSIVHAASAVMADKSAALSVLASDPLGDGLLVYRWSVAAAPAPVTFSANDSNAARDTIAGFTRAGTYLLDVRVSNGAGLSTTQQLSVSVTQALAGLAVAPQDVELQPLDSNAFTAAAVDQFGDAMVPALRWSVTGGGTIDALGRFVAGTEAGGPYTVTASCGAVQATAAVTVASSLDLNRPAVTLTSPLPDSEGSGVLLLEADASDDVQVAQVSFFVDGQLLARTTAAPWQAELETHGLADGTHVLDAVATDSSGNTARSAAVAVHVHNGGSRPDGITGTTGCTSSGGLALPLLIALWGLRRRRRPM